MSGHRVPLAESQKALLLSPEKHIESIENTNEPKEARIEVHQNIPELKEEEENVQLQWKFRSSGGGDQYW